MKSYEVNPLYPELKTFLFSLPQRFEAGEGTSIREARNSLRIFQVEGMEVVVKSFGIPNLLNRLVYGIFRSCKAKRSFRYASLLLKNGIGSPLPLGWISFRKGLLFGRSYYVSLRSSCPYTFENLMKGEVEREEDVLRAIALTTARLHDGGMLHKDYSRGNILIGFRPEGTIQIELIDLNRIRFCRTISVEKGLQNMFERLPVSSRQHDIMKKTYREARSNTPQKER